jgi:hypothetical protein
MTHLTKLVEEVACHQRELAKLHEQHAANLDAIARAPDAEADGMVQGLSVNGDLARASARLSGPPAQEFSEPR